MGELTCGTADTHLDGSKVGWKRDGREEREGREERREAREKRLRPVTYHLLHSFPLMQDP